MPGTYLVVGASKGIGLAIVSTLLKYQNNVVAVARNGSNELDMLGGLYGEKLSTLEADVARQKEAGERVGEAISRFGRIDGMAYCAGLLKPNDIQAVDEQEIEDSFAVNVKGLIGLTALTVQSLSKSENPSIVAVASLIGTRCSLKGLSVYGASKAAVCGFVAGAALDLAPFGIRVNAVSPGFVNTSMLEPLGAEKIEKIASHIPLGRVAAPDEIASVVQFLLSPLASYITGQMLIVDGGASLPESPAL